MLIGTLLLVGIETTLSGIVRASYFGDVELDCFHSPLHNRETQEHKNEKILLSNFSNTGSEN